MLAMKTRDVSLIFAICWTTSLLAGVHLLPSDVKIRARVLHQPLFPIDTPPPVSPAPDASDQPFFPEIQPPPDQTPPPPVRQNATASMPLPATSQSSNATKTVAIAASVGIVTLGMLSALAFFLHRRKLKLSGTDIPSFPQNSGAPPSSILYMGTMEPSVSAGISSSNPKLNGVKELNRERYRPSPELQPLPPLNMPTSVISSSDDESRESASYHTPHGSSAMSPTSRKSYIGINPLGRRDPFNHSVLFPHSRRTSPKSRLSVSSPTAPLPSSSPPLHLISNSGTSAKIPPNSIGNSSIKENRATPPPPPPPPPPSRPPRPPPPPLKPKLPIHDENTSSVGGSSSLRNEPGNVTTTSKEEEEEEEPESSKPKLKPLHWDKVPATSDRATVWDQLKSGSFQLNEDMIESLFGCNSNPQLDKEPAWRAVHPPTDQENRVLDPKKSQNIAILLRALNVTRDEVSAALLDGNPEGLGTELLETLVKMAPTKEEERKLKDYNGNISKLGSAERFLKGLLDIPFAFKRIEVMLYRANFENEVKFLRNSYQTLERASEELRRSRLFLKILEAVLRTGNRMNVGTNRGDAEAFKLDTLLKLVDVKGTDGKTTLLHFVVQEIIRSEVGSGSHDDFKKKELVVVSGLGRDLENVKRAAGMDSDVLSSYVSKLESGLEKVRMVLPNMEGDFFRSTKVFIERAEGEIVGVKEDGKKALVLVKEVTEYFHGDAAKEEAHPFRIFVIVRDFLSVLDHVCRDVGRMRSGGVLVGSARSFRISM